MSISNIVASAKSVKPLTLETIEDQFFAYVSSHLFRRIKQFGSVNIKLRSDTVLQLFPNGTIIIIGGKSEEEAKTVFEGYLSLLLDLGIEIKYENYHIRNIVATFYYGKRVLLNEVAWWNNFEFEPELFPAVRYRIQHLGVTCNIFHTGKCNILGAKSEDIIKQAVVLVQEALKNADCGR